MSNEPESMFSLEDLFTRVNDAFVKAAIRLEKTFNDKANSKDSDDKWTAPYFYHMPKMTLRVQLSLSSSKKEIKGFFRNATSGTDQSMVSEITIDVVAVPRNA